MFLLTKNIINQRGISKVSLCIELILWKKKSLLALNSITALNLKRVNLSRTFSL